MIKYVEIIGKKTVYKYPELLGGKTDLVEEI
jgi:hypothetical protein